MNQVKENNIKKSNEPALLTNLRILNETLTNQIQKSMKSGSLQSCRIDPKHLKRLNMNESIRIVNTWVE